MYFQNTTAGDKILIQHEMVRYTMNKEALVPRPYNVFKLSRGAGPRTRSDHDYRA